MGQMDGHVIETNSLCVQSVAFALSYRFILNESADKMTKLPANL